MYSLKDLVTMTMLSDRTLRNYLGAGILRGKKENGAWVFTAEQVDAFLQNNVVKSAINSKRSSIINDFVNNTGKKENSVCMIWDLQETDALQVGNFICDAAGKRNGLQMSYESHQGRSRIILSGSEADIYEIMTEYHRRFPPVSGKA